MDKILVKKESENDRVFIFDVLIGVGKDATYHKITLDRQYWEELTDKKMSPERLVEHAIIFLLGKENKSSILPAFNMRVIHTYFPDFEKVKYHNK